MCPDRQLLSAFADGEIPEPFAARVRSHVGACPECAKVVQGYALISNRLKAAPEPSFSQSQGRIREELELREGMPNRGPSAWHRSVSIPLPLAAGIAAAFTLLLALSLLYRPVSSAPYPQRAYVAQGEGNTGVINAQGVDFQLLKNAQASGAEFNIVIPGNQVFSYSGEPELIVVPQRGGK
jgi:anti-sigma factor RsiW